MAFSAYRDANADLGTILTLPASSGAGNFNSDNQYMGSARGVIVVVSVTVASGTVSIVPKVQGYDSSSGTYYDLVAGAAITATGTARLVVYPGVTVAANTAVSHPMPPTWRVRLESGAGVSPVWSGTVGASLCL
jgi:hypothetical protein